MLACHGLDEICINTQGSFRCECADGFIQKNGVCVRKQLPSECSLLAVWMLKNREKKNLAFLFHSLSPPTGVQEKGLFEDIQDDELEVLQQMFFGVVLCALATLAAKGDLVYTSVFIGAAAAMVGYWLSERGDRLLNSFLKGR